MLDSLIADDTRVGSFQPAWALRGHLLAHLDRAADSVAAYHRAIELTTDIGEREYLTNRTAQARGRETDR
ncbi:MAG: hypothetical protein L0J17_12230 [Brevibacterium sp.]|uniref:hypothetical protein n=1 Tax=Brevibacterium sp. TaxID=1701 RepID=UPI002648F496|nr:hypothetical protein [Brevibacterium sp.]MDN5807022.1 hypothetical protein [Brevibacterium sp.]MDN5833410.1 hypothetical protein [Brevibacterium sp.]MDN5875923.1 hypothetical protein [Brevibacterium sp.]MDN5908912.1 hypothetical protein [Brevibacterium sp.]MDN6134051.1 hypothetical protein [Brevibacterium sp.]